MSKILCISDTHGFHNWFTRSLHEAEADILIHAGDVSTYGDARGLADFIKWFNQFTHIPNKVFIAGNHDRMLEHQSVVVQDLLKGAGNFGITYLQNSAAVINGLTIYGSPRTPVFGNWSFMYPRGDTAINLWQLIPNNTDILVTHGPPAGILDYVPRDNTHAGCTALRDRVLDIQPRLHVFGHIHEPGGQQRTQPDCRTAFVNAALLDDAYQPTHKPVAVTIL